MTDGDVEQNVSRSSEGLPRWVSITVLLTVTALLVYSVVVYGVDGYPLSVMLGGIVGLYGGLNELVKRKAAGRDE